jgi:hypothetical protein
LKVRPLSFEASRVPSQSARVGGANIHESRCSLGSEGMEEVDCGETRESRSIAVLRVCSADSTGVIIAVSDGPTSVSEPESFAGGVDLVSGMMGRFEGGDGREGPVSWDSCFRFRFA